MNREEFEVNIHEDENEDILVNDNDDMEYEDASYHQARKGGIISKIIILVMTVIILAMGYMLYKDTGKLSSKEIKQIKAAEEILDIMYKTEVDNVASIGERLKPKFITSEFYKVDATVTNIVDRYAPFTHVDNELKYYYKTTYAVQDGFTVLLGYRIVRGESQSSVKESHFHFNADGLVDEYNEYDLVDAITY